MRFKLALSTLTSLLLLSACGDDTGTEDNATAGDTSVTEEVEKRQQAPSRTPGPTPDPEVLPTTAIGEAVTFDDATIIVQVAETVTEIPTESYTDNLYPTEGESLHLITMEWTNLSNEAVSKKCFGPYTVDMRVYDNQNREMLLSNDSGHIVGNDCSNGLLTGQSGPWIVAYQGLEGAELGYITFQRGYTDMPKIVLVDENLTMTMDNSGM